MVSQWSWMFWRVVMSARLRAYFLVRSPMTRNWCEVSRPLGRPMRIMKYSVALPTPSLPPVTPTPSPWV